MVPFIKLHETNQRVDLIPGKTLAQLESEFISSGQAKSSVAFIAPDGCRYGKQTNIEDILDFPFFRIRVDNISEYHCMSSSHLRGDFLKMNRT